MKRALLFSIIISVFLIPQSVHAQNMAGQSHFGLHLSGIQMMGGDESSQFKTWGGFNFGHLFTDRFGLDFSLSAGWTRPGEDEDNISYRTYLYPFSVSARYYLKEDSRLSPYLTAGLGVLFWGLRDVTDEDDTLLPFNPEGSIIGDSVNRESFALLGIGAQYYLSDAISLDLGLRYNYLIEHETDLSGYGDEHSGIIEARLGINFIFTCKQDSEVKKAVVQVIPELPVVTPVEVAEPVKVVEVVEEPEPVVEEEIILEVVEESPVKEAELVFEEKAPIILEGVNFASDSSVLNEEAQETLDQVVRTLVNHPEIDLEIHGYTDNMGDRNYNIMLSQQRADSVMNYLIDNGIEPERLSAEGFGPDNPIASNDSKEGRAQNRRIEFIRKD